MSVEKQDAPEEVKNRHEVSRKLLCTGTSLLALLEVLPLYAAKHKLLGRKLISDKNVKEERYVGIPFSLRKITSLRPCLL